MKSSRLRIMTGGHSGPIKLRYRPSPAPVLPQFFPAPLDTGMAVFARQNPRHQSCILSSSTAIRRAPWLMRYAFNSGLCPLCGRQC